MKVYTDKLCGFDAFRLRINQKQAEAERLTKLKLEAERLSQEEAKRVAEEAESAEQEDQNEA
ncbi:hypothetical protein [Providencia rettgeri]|uniref:hypothetical protein n=1 Tax=Providencia rettgeri TaxID=587 RepID=UPI001E4F44A1|nr:hypothetical protein [Providencia rettgeri]UFK93462.1 hypothetical protein LMY39_14085 [Providencia rettgeri]